MRPIDADAMKRYIDCGHLRPPTEKCFSELDVVQMLDKFPTIDLNCVIHAHWEKTYDLIDGHDGYKCSMCGHTKYFDHYKDITIRTLYCEKCGARMDGDPHDSGQ